MSKIDDGCVFCKIAHNEIPSNKVYEDQDVIAFLDVNPASKGHTLVVSKEHFMDFTRVPKSIISHSYQVAQLITQACITQLGATGANVITNVGKSAGQSIFHYHIHVVPRYNDDRIGLLFNHPLELPSDSFPLLASSIKSGIVEPDDKDKR